MNKKSSWNQEFQVSLILQAMKNNIAVLLYQEAEKVENNDLIWQAKTNWALLITFEFVFYWIFMATLKDKHYQIYLCKEKTFKI